MVLNLDLSQMLSDFIRGLEARQKVLDSGAIDAITLEKMTAELKEYVDQQRLALDNTELQLSTFTHYLDLPDLVVLKILSFLTNPQDLLNLLIAFPKKEQHAPLTKEQLEFELAFPEMIRSYELHWDDDYELRSLSLRSDHHRKVILRHFEHFLVNDISNTERVTRLLNIPLGPPYNRCFPIDKVVRLARSTEREEALKEWNKFPVTRRVDIFLKTPPNPEDMDMVGSSLWHAEIILWRQWIELESEWRKVCRCLAELPNLRNLYVRHVWEEGNEPRNSQDFEWIIAPIQLPELPFLKSLSFHETKFNNRDTFRIFRMLLERYGEQLNQLGFTISWPFQGIQIQFPVDLPPCPNLTLLSFVDQSVYRDGPYTPPWQGRQQALRYMSNFREAKLKTIKLLLNGCNGIWALYRLLEYMGPTFGQILEHLILEFRQDELNCGLEAPSPSLVQGLQFPKLVHFVTNLKFSRELYEALIRFSALEKLEIRRSKEFSSPWKVERSEQLNWEDQKNLLTEQIWKDLPRLKWIHWQKVTGYKEKITREQVEGNGGHEEKWKDMGTLTNIKEEANGKQDEVEIVDEVETVKENVSGKESKNGKLLRVANACKTKIQSIFGRSK